MTLSEWNAAWALLAACVLLVSMWLAGCTAEQISTGTDRVAAACAAVMPLAQQAAMLPPYGPAVAAFALAACGSNAGIARLAADPTSAAWLDEQAAQLRAILHRSS